MSKTTKKPEPQEDEFESLESEDLNLDEGLDDKENSELEESLDSKEETTEELPESLDDLEAEEPEPVKPAPKKPAAKAPAPKTPVKPAPKKPAAKAPAPKTPAKPAPKKPEPVAEETLEDEVTLEEGEPEADPEPEPEPVKPAPKKAPGKAPAAKKTEEEPKTKIEEFVSKYGGEYDEEFDIKKIKIGKYEVRESERNPETIKKLSDDIKSRGQLEPVHIVHEGKEYHLIAGYHRYLAMKELKLDTMRAIVYKDLSFGQIQAIATGTNAIRTDLSEWDKVCAVAKYHEANPEIPISHKSETATTLCTIFGYKKTRIYEYINVYDFLKNFKNEALLEFIKSANLPFHYLTGLYNVREHVKPEDTDAIIKLFTERPDLRIKEFDIEFTSYLNEIHLSTDEGAAEDAEELAEVEGLEIPKGKDKKDKIEEAMADDGENDEGKELSRNIKKKTNECINKMTEIHTILTELTQYENLKELVEEKVTKVLIKRSTEVSKLASKLFN